MDYSLTEKKEVQKNKSAQEIVLQNTNLLCFIFTFLESKFLLTTLNKVNRLWQQVITNEKACWTSTSFLSLPLQKLSCASLAKNLEVTITDADSKTMKVPTAMEINTLPVQIEYSNYYKTIVPSSSLSHLESIKLTLLAEQYDDSRTLYAPLTFSSFPNLTKFEISTRKDCDHYLYLEGALDQIEEALRTKRWNENFNHLCFFGFKILDRSFSDFHYLSQSLQILEIVDCRINPLTLGIQNLVSLKKLTLGNEFTEEIGHSGFSKIIYQQNRNLFFNLKQLETLELQNHGLYLLPYFYFREEEKENIERKVPTNLSIYVAYHSYYKTMDLSTIFSVISELLLDQVTTFKTNCFLTPNSNFYVHFKQILNYCPNLTELETSPFEKGTLSSVLCPEKMKKVKLVLTDTCYYLSQAGSIKELKLFNNLEILDVPWRYLESKCFDLFSFFPSLKKLHLHTYLFISNTDAEKHIKRYMNHYIKLPEEDKKNRNFKLNIYPPLSYLHKEIKEIIGRDHLTYYPQPDF